MKAHESPWQSHGPVVKAHGTHYIALELYQMAAAAPIVLKLSHISAMENPMAMSLQPVP